MKALASSLAALLALAVACDRQDPPPPVEHPPPAAPAAKGRVETKRFHSDALGVDKDIVVWLPAGYDRQPDKHYRVFVYLHGLGGKQTDWIEHGHLDAAADAMQLDAIVVMPRGDDSFYVDSPTPADYDACLRDGTGLFMATREHHATCVRKNDYETYVTRDVLGWVDRSYRTLPARDARGIAGDSMGGYGALMLAMRHPDLFAAAASHSGVDALTYLGPHPYVPGQLDLLDATKLAAARPTDPLLAWVGSRFGGDIAFWRDHDPSVLATKLAPGALALYLDCGTEDLFHLDDEARYLHDILVAQHVDHSYFIGPGGHDFKFWRDRVASSLTFLADHTKG